MMLFESDCRSCDIYIYIHKNNHKYVSYWTTWINVKLVSVFVSVWYTYRQSIQIYLSCASTARWSGHFWSLAPHGFSRQPAWLHHPGARGEHSAESSRELKRAQCRDAACDYWAKVHYPGASAGVCEGKLPRRTHCTNLGFWRCLKGTQGVRMGFCGAVLDLCIPFASATGIWRGWSDRFPFRTKLEAHRRWFLSICNTWICPWPWRVLPCYHALRPYMAHLRSDFVGPDWLIGCLLLGWLVGWWVDWLIDLWCLVLFILLCSWKVCNGSQQPPS